MVFIIAKILVISALAINARWKSKKAANVVLPTEKFLVGSIMKNKKKSLSVIKFVKRN